MAEDYPELKANQNFLELQKDISNVENDIQYARRYYNGAVRNINTRIDSFPDLIIARFFNYRGVPIWLHYPVGGGIHALDEWVDLRSLSKMIIGLKNFVLAIEK